MSKPRRPGDPPVIDPIDEHIGARIKAIRLLRGMGQRALSEAIGLTFQQVQKYERGVNRVSAVKLFKLAEILGVEVGYFYEGLPQGAKQPTISIADQLISTTGGLELAKCYLHMSPAQRRGTLEIARAHAPEKISA